MKQINGKAKQSNKSNFPQKLNIDNKVRLVGMKWLMNLTNVLQTLVHH